MKQEYKPLRGRCVNCLGCNKLEDSEFMGVYRCEYATSEAISIESLRKELKEDG